jgi:hypothetical protein
MFTCLRVFPMFSSSTIKVLGFAFGSLTYFELVSVQGEIYGVQLQFFWMWTSTFPSTTCWRCCLSPRYIFGTFVENLMAVVVWAYFWISYSIISFYLLLCLYHVVLIAKALKYSLKSGIVIPQALLCFAQDCYEKFCASL